MSEQVPTEQSLEAFKSSFAEVHPRLRAFFGTPDENLSDEDSWLVASIGAKISEQRLWTLSEAFYDGTYILMVIDRDKDSVEGFVIFVEKSESELQSAPSVRVQKTASTPLSEGDVTLLASLVPQFDPLMNEAKVTIVQHQSSANN